MASSHAAAMATAAMATATAATARECRRRQGKRRTERTRDEATKKLVVHPHSSVVELQRRMPSQKRTTSRANGSDDFN
jgi:hypothetical protein